MDSHEIQNRMDDLSRAMLAKGLRNPSAQVQVQAHVAPLVYMTWGVWPEPDSRTEIIRDPDIREAIQTAFDLVKALPSPEEAKRQHFMASLAKVIDLGRENGIEVDFVNPLVETMKRLSENALTYQPAPQTDASDFDDGNITA
jgi:hypothetical protein